MQHLLLCIQFFSRIPVHRRFTLQEDDLARSTAFLPVVGLFTGAVSGAVYLAGFRLVGPLFAAVCGVLTSTIVTGGMHLDGLADTCDGLFSGRPREEMLTIMRDSRIGTFGALALLFDLLVKITLIISLDPTSGFRALLLSPVVSRGALVMVIYLSTRARAGEGLGNLFIGRVTIREVFTAAVFTLATIAFFFRWFLVVGAMVVYLLAWRMERYFRGKLGGMTGDTFGSVNECGELLFLLLVAVGGKWVGC